MSAGEEVVTIARYRDADDSVGGYAQVWYSNDSSKQLLLYPPDQTGSLKQFVYPYSIANQRVDFRINGFYRPPKPPDYIDIEVYANRTNLKVAAPSVDLTNGNLYLPHSVTTSTPFTPNAIWVSLVLWANKDKVVASDSPKLGEWGLVNCVNKGNCSDKIFVPFNKRVAIPRGLNSLRVGINTSYAYAETTRGDNYASVVLDDFYSENIPTIMNNVAPNWWVARNNLNTWFNQPEKPSIKNRTISGIDWNLLVFYTVGVDWFIDPANASNTTRIRDKYRELIRPSYFNIPDTQVILQQRVRQKFNQNPSATSVNLSTEYSAGIPFKDYHSQQITYITAQTGGTFGYSSIDAVTGAFGGFSFYLVPVGTAVKEGNNYKITINEVHVHVVDSFDFNGDQPLGCWGLPNIVRVNNTTGSLHCYDNSHFRKYRFMKARGFDYNVFSPPKKEKLPTPVSYLVPK